MISKTLLDKQSQQKTLFMTRNISLESIEFAIIDYIYNYDINSSCKELTINFKDSESNKSSTEFLLSITIENKFHKAQLDLDQELRIKK